MKLFEKVRIDRPQRSGFDLSHEVKTTVLAGELVPVMVQEVLPSDHFKINLETFVRTQPLLAPLMHRVNVYAHAFFVPNRIIWDDWEKFITGGTTGADVVNMPKVTFPNTTDYNTHICKGSLADYLGLPTEVVKQDDGALPSVSQLPFRAYQKIYNDFYRDSNIQPQADIIHDSYDLEVTDGDFAANLNLVRLRNWEKDYFTSALPTAQRGNPVRIPIAGMADVTGRPIIVEEGTAVPFNEQGLKTSNTGGLMNDAGTKGGSIYAGLGADLTDNTGTINDLKRAYAIQSWLQASMQGGYRYVESLLHWFGVRSSDQRLQRPEYLGGGKLPITIGEVLQTSETNNTAQGTMAGRGVGASNVHCVNKTFEEHGFVIVLMSIMPRTAYMQGIPKVFLKDNRFDYFFKQFAHIGEQEVYNKEVFVSDYTGENNDGVFGYQSRYAEYRFNNDKVTGGMRSEYDYWHWARIFSNMPALNDSFIRCLPDDRIFPTDLRDNPFLVQLYFDFYANRPLPEYSQAI